MAIVFPDLDQCFEFPYRWLCDSDSYQLPLIPGSFVLEEEGTRGYQVTRVYLENRY